MIKKISIAILLILLSGTILAVSFTIDPANIMTAWYNSRHWPAVTAAALFSGMVAATWKMGNLENETQAKMVSDLFKTARYIAILLLIIEFYKPIKGFGINLLGFAFDAVKGFFGFMAGIL